MKYKNVFKKNRNFIVLNMSYLLLMFSPLTFAMQTIDQSLVLAVSRGSIQEVQQAISAGARVDVVLDGNTPLHIAAQNGYTEIAALLLSKRPDMVNHENSRRETPLHLAAQQGHNEVIELLLSKKANINAFHDISVPYVPNRGFTPLYLAAENGHIQTVKLLLDRGANTVEAACALGGYVNTTPLWAAVVKGHIEIVKLLLAKERAGLLAKVTDEASVFVLRAAEKGHTEIVKLLLNNLHRIDTSSYWYEQALGIAAREGHIEMVKLFLNKNPNTRDASSREYQDALYFAARAGHTEILKLLLNNARHIDTPYVKYQHALYKAVERQDIKMVKLLLDSVPCLHTTMHYTPRDFYKMALSRAAAGGYIEILKLIIDKSSNTENLNKAIPGLLHLATENIEMVKLLLRHLHRLDILSDSDHHCYHYYKEALHGAANRGHAEILKLLLDKISDTETFFHEAAKRGDSETVKLLLDKGFNIEVLNTNKETALHLAVAKGHGKTMQLLLGRGAQVHAFNLNNQTPLHYVFPFFSMDDRSLSQIRKIKIDNIKIFIKLLLWHNYQSSQTRINNDETPIYQSIRSLVLQIETIDLRILPADQKEYFEQVQCLIRWIFNETSRCQSKKEFLAKILQYLLESNPSEQQNLLKKHIKNLLLKNYLLNKENSDFYDLKSTFPKAQLQTLKELESFLRNTYAQKLKKKFFPWMNKIGLENKLKDLKKQESDLTVLRKITRLRTINKPVIQYCNDTSIEAPFKNNILEIDKASRVYALIQWIQQQQSTKKDLNEKSISNNQEKSYSTTSKAIWSNWGVSYLEDSKQLLVDIYNHLDYIIQEKGTQINSDTPFGRNKIDILKFEKEDTTEFHDHPR